MMAPWPAQVTRLYTSIGCAPPRGRSSDTACRANRVWSSGGINVLRAMIGWPFP